MNATLLCGRLSWFRIHWAAHDTLWDFDQLLHCDAEEETPSAQVEVRSERVLFHVYPLQTCACDRTLLGLTDAR